MKIIDLKTLLGVILLLFFITSCNSNKTNVKPTGATIGIADEQEDPDPDPPSPVRQPNLGIGPVLPQESNFYFGGTFSVKDSIPLFIDCSTGKEIPVSTVKGDFLNILKKYYQLVGTSGQPVFIQARGFLIYNEIPDDTHPYRLVMTYLNDMQQNVNCESNDKVSGEWECSVNCFTDTKVALKLYDNYTFEYFTDSKDIKTKTRGTWQMSSNDRIFLNYMKFNPYLGHVVSYNDQEGTMLLMTEKGSMIFKKK